MTALKAAYTALFNRLRGQSAWGGVYSDFAQAGTVRPYVVFFVSGGGDERVTFDAHHARLVVTVKCVADRLTESLTGAAQVEALLRDQGCQEVTSGGIPETEGWAITTVTQGAAVHLVEMYQGAQPIYHDGHQYTITMEKVES